VLVDFGGICHGWRPEQSGGSTVTGTYGYMPPEQLMGRMSPQSDLYALGATLLYVVTGREPTDFDFDSGRLSVPEAIELRPALRGAIDAMLAPAPRDRPRTAKDARAILLGAATESASAPSRALVPVRRGGPPATMGGDAPRWVDVGPPPRDPKGLFVAAGVSHAVWWETALRRRSRWFTRGSGACACPNRTVRRSLAVTQRPE
jgi:serine/threonine protein kinase